MGGNNQATGCYGCCTLKQFLKRLNANLNLCKVQRTQQLHDRHESAYQGNERQA